MRIVDVVLHQDPDNKVWWAESPELPGYTATDPELNPLLDLVREGLAEFLGEPVEVRERLSDDLDWLPEGATRGGTTNRWVGMTVGMPTSGAFFAFKVTQSPAMAH